MKISSYSIACVPRPEASPRFMKSILQEETRTLYGPDGKVASKENVKISRCVPILDDEFENKGITSDMFDVEVCQKAGVQMHEFDMPFYGMTIDSMSQMDSDIRAAMDAVESQTPKND